MVASQLASVPLGIAVGQVFILRRITKGGFEFEDQLQRGEITSIAEDMNDY